VSLLRQVWRDLMSRRQALVRVLHDETGKPFGEIETMELATAELIVRYYTSNAHRILQDQAAWRPWVMANKRTYVRYVPRGLIGLVTPWNMPFLIPFADAFAAMLAGNAVLLKPSEWTTRTALWIEDAVRTTGLLPEGLLSVATGDGTVGRQVIAESDMVLFTGSTRSGKLVAQSAAGDLKPCVLELGGKHPMIVFKDASITRAAKAAVWGAFANCGQVCIGVERVYVESEIHDAFVEAVRREMAGLRQGLGGDVDVGRLIFPPQLQRIKEQLEDARALGAHVIGGDVIDEDNLLIQPALVLKADHRMRVMTEETFGPVMPIMKVDRGEEAVRLSNEGPFGLSASLWTADIERAERLGLSLEDGMIGINDVMSQYAVCSLPFGGIKQSGMGRRHSDEGLRMFCWPQAVYIHEWPANVPELWWFPYEPLKAKIISWLTRLS
jgi:acyl-CoA reductase-like NAD-dependent aldehyde dehydrogenase